MTPHRPLAGGTAPRVLVVEDELLIALALETTLTTAGYSVAGPCSDVDTALRSLRGPAVDAALLDIDLDGQKVFPVADALADSGVPFAFLTGYGKAAVPERHAGRRQVNKPYMPRDLLKALEDIIATAAAQYA